MNLESRWYDFCDKINSDLSFCYVNSIYSRPKRFYHTLEGHVKDCLEEFDNVKSLSKDPLEAEAALWFHDIVYDPLGEENEEQSAGLACRLLSKSNLQNYSFQNIFNLIIATDHQEVPKDNDGKLVVDIDLSIFGKPKEVFDEYEANIRKEYSYYNDKKFNAGRKHVLEKFLEREQIYYTDFFRDKYEEKARANLKHSLTKLNFCCGFP